MDLWFADAFTLKVELFRVKIKESYQLHILYMQPGPNLIPFLIYACLVYIPIPLKSI